MIIYHYRSIGTAKSEIGNHSIKFSNREEVNDPLEGYISLFWQGDRPAWEGLFRNYFCSFFSAYDELSNNNGNLDISNNIVICDAEKVHPAIRNAAEALLADRDVQMITDALSRHSVKCGREEMEAVLSILSEKLVDTIVYLGNCCDMDIWHAFL